MRDLLRDGLPILDLLEITCSTDSVAALTRCNQSSVSRLYRHASHQLGLDFRKTKGHYKAHANLEILQSLRQASQLLRLNQDGGQLRWLGNPYSTTSLQMVGDSDPLTRQWLDAQRMLKLLHERVLDLAVINDLKALPPGLDNSRGNFRFGDWVIVGLVNDRRHVAVRPAGAPSSRGGTGLAVVVLLHEHLQHPAVQALIGRIREAYQNAYQRSSEMAWA